MPLLNYTTTVPADRTITQVTAILAKAGARQIMTTYDGNGNPMGVAFGIDTKNGGRAFELPVNIQKVFQVMMADPRMPNHLKTFKQAERIAWRIIKDWLEVQLALISTDMVTIDEVMLAYMKDEKTGKTVYELFNEGHLITPAITAG